MPLGPTLSLRGLDSRYYARDADGTLINDTGTGNTLNARRADGARPDAGHAAPFRPHCGVDGFRFDLAPILARAPGFDPHAPIFAAIADDPLLKDRDPDRRTLGCRAGRLSAGQFPARWLEWNDRYRDDVRRFWRGDAQHRRRAGHPPDPARPTFSPARTAAASISSPPMTASPWPTWSPIGQAQRATMAKTIATAMTRISPGTMASKVPATIRRDGAARQRLPRPARHPVRVARHHHA